MTVSGRSTPEMWRQEKIEEEFSRIRNALSDSENLMLRYKNYPEDIPKYSFEVERVAIRKFANENPHTDVTFTRVVLRRFFEI
ncbi:hypothetical protein ACTXT7_015141, partial [Hymenolepis weldensis]